MYTRSEVFNMRTTMWMSWRVLLTVMLAIITAEAQYNAPRPGQSAEDEVPVNYQNYTVLRVQSSELNLKVLQQLQHQPGVDFWSDPSRIVENVDMMVSPRIREHVEQQLKYEGIPFKTTIPDVQTAIDITRGTPAQSDEAELLRSDPGHGMTFNAYHRYGTIAAFMDFVNQNSANQMCSTFTVGRSYLGQTIKGVKCGRGQREVWLDGGMHAREWITPATVTYLINEFFEHPENHADILDKFTIYMLPVANPDGYEYTHTNDRLWRKTRNQNEGSKCVGTDLNRNFDIKWGEVASSSDPCNLRYSGSAPFSTPEGLAIKNAILSRRSNLEMFVTFHSFGQMIFVPYGYSEDARPTDYDELLRVANIGKNAIQKAGGPQYRVGQASKILYAASGASDDWAKEKAGIKYSFGVELRDRGRDGFFLPPSYIEPSGRETLAFVKTMIKAMRFQ